MVVRPMEVTSFWCREPFSTYRFEFFRGAGVAVLGAGVYLLFFSRHLFSLLS